MSNYVIGSGWFSDEYSKTEMGAESNRIQKNYGGINGRNSRFSKYWLSHILNQNTLPKKILIFSIKLSVFWLPGIFF